MVFFLVDLASDFSWGVVFFLWVVVFWSFLGEGFSSSWQIFLLGVLNFGRIFFKGVILGVLSMRFSWDLGGAGSRVPPATLGGISFVYPGANFSGPFLLEG